MTAILYSIIGLLLAGFGVLLYFIFQLKKRAEQPPDDGVLKVMMEWMRELKQDVQQDRELTQKNIHETNKQINDRLTEAARVIGRVQQDMGAITQIGPDIRRLSETLASPKLRGNFGEEMLENMLSQILPRSGYHLQYKFKNGEIVDAIVRTGDKILSIDSKFSLENFRLFKEAREEAAAENLKRTFLRDVKKRIDEVNKKYILPQEQTHDFALMYVPSEGVYQELIIDPATMEYARARRVMPVGPNSLFVLLQSVVVSLRGLQINQTAQQILTMILGIRRESDKFAAVLNTLGTHIKNAGNTMGAVHNDFAKLKMSIHNAAELQLEQAEEAAVQSRQEQELLP